MARRRELKNIANGLMGSFNSRNNDIDGYWGLGKLYKHAQLHKTTTVKINLLGNTIQPETNEFDNLLEQYNAMFLRLIDSANINRNWIKSVLISVNFESEYIPEFHYWRSALGKPYICKCVITDDNDKQYSILKYNNCLPHNPLVETRSSRAEAM